MTPIYHVAGCGELAFSFLHEPYEGMPLTVEMVQYPDGTQPDPDTMALCGSCQEPIEVKELSARVNVKP